MEVERSIQHISQSYFVKLKRGHRYDMNVVILALAARSNGYFKIRIQGEGRNAVIRKAELEDAAYIVESEEIYFHGCLAGENPC